MDVPTSRLLCANGEELRAAPVTLRLGNASLTLSARLWRDFQPFASPDGGPLIVTVTVKTSDGTPVPASADAPLLWVLNGGETWQSPLTNQPAPVEEGAGRIVKCARNGPKWDTGISVDVVALITDEKGGEHLLRAQGQVIQRVE